MNNVQLRGRLVADPEIRTFMKGNNEPDSVAAFVLAVPDRTKKDKDGNFEADFIRCSVFGKASEVLESFGCKGCEIIVSQGKIKTGSYDKDGERVYTTEVLIQTFEFVSGTKSKEEKAGKEGSKDKDSKK